jgi:hypothetical protein
MKLIELHWSYNIDEAIVKYSKTFEEESVIVKLDMLQDCIADLQNKYELLLNKDFYKD